MQRVLFVVLMFASLFWANAAVASEATVNATCTRSDVSINEVDYDQPNVDDLEFIELEGTPFASLNGYQLRLVNSSGTVYRTISLTGHAITSSGFFVIGNDNLFNTPQITLADNSLSNERAVVAIFDVTNNVYCNAINYEGTVAGFGDWLYIGADEDYHGLSRGCARATGGWWSCNRPTTAGGSNGVVSIQLSSSQTLLTSHIMLIMLFVLCGFTTLLTTRYFRKHRNV